ncbi:hypothetical protein [Compostibacter hankyongensis]|uniref:hypothetical protein n=1 Tax=Compostibacter hankyongensis TaxID=1007089 RepID=UPI0031F03F68
MKKLFVAAFIVAGFGITAFAQLQPNQVANQQAVLTDTVPTDSSSSIGVPSGTDTTAAPTDQAAPADQSAPTDQSAPADQAPAAPDASGQ